MPPLKDTSLEEAILTQWMGEYAFDHTRLWYEAFGKPSCFRALVALFVASVEQGRVYMHIEDPGQEFIAWAAYDLALRRPALHKDIRFHGMLDIMLKSSGNSTEFMDALRAERGDST